MPSSRPEFADHVGNIDRLRDENIDLNKLNQSMLAELNTTKEILLKDEHALEMEKKKHIDALREVQDRLDKRTTRNMLTSDLFVTTIDFWS